MDQLPAELLRLILVNLADVRAPGHPDDLERYPGLADLCRSSLVNRAWLDAARPLIWRHLVLETLPNDSEELQQDRRRRLGLVVKAMKDHPERGMLVRSIALSFDRELAAMPTTPALVEQCPLLSYLSIEGMSTLELDKLSRRGVLSELITLLIADGVFTIAPSANVLQQYPKLTTLRLLELEMDDASFAAILSPPTLRTLTISGVRGVSDAAYLEAIKLPSANLRTLSIWALLDPDMGYVSWYEVLPTYTSLENLELSLDLFPLSSRLIDRRPKNRPLNLLLNFHLNWYFPITTADADSV
ncbi:hypothetical protein MNV49_004524 [Pseudohyphozyma bogoriensis]|nr:hypothetical protein MNV49_004524 [Pseudohyphozyma bogoriensis]